MILALLLAASSWVPVVSDARHQVVALQIQKPDDPQHTLVQFCSGVVVALRPVQILTEAHCLDEPIAGHDVYADGVRVEEVRRKDDVVLLATVGSGYGRSDKWKVMDVRKDPPRPGESVAALGYWEDKYVVTTGIVSGYGITNPLTYFNMELFAGMSGGPVVDSRGRLVSLVWGVEVDVPGSPNAIAYGPDLPSIWAVLQPNR